MSSPTEYAFDSWLRVQVNGDEYDGQVRSSDSAGVVVNIVGMGQRRVKHAEIVDTIDAPSRPAGAPVTAPTSAVDTESPTTPVDEVLTIPLASVVPFLRNPRQFKRLEDGSVDPDQHGLRQLAQSLCTLGQQQPASVRLLPDGRYGLIDGERRYHGLALANLTTINVIVREMDDAEALAATVAASNLSEPYGIRDRARAVTWLLSEKRTQTEVAELLGIDQPSVSILQRVFALPGPVQELVEQGKLRFGHVRYLVRDHLLQHPKILIRIAEIAAAKEARVRDLEPEIPFEAELPVEMVRALRPQERMVLEETLTPSSAEAQNGTVAPQDTNRVPHSSGVTETRTETNTVKTTTTTPAPVLEPPANYIDEEQTAWRKGRAAAMRNLPFAPPEDLTVQWIAGWETVRPAPVDPKKQPVKTAVQLAEEKAAQQAAKPGALKTAEEKVAEQKGGKPVETRTSALIPSALVDRLATLGGNVVPALETWCELATVINPYELDAAVAIDLLRRFLDACCEAEVDPEAAIGAIGGGRPATEAVDAAA